MTIPIENVYLPLRTVTCAHCKWRVNSNRAVRESSSDAALAYCFGCISDTDYYITQDEYAQQFDALTPSQKCAVTARLLAARKNSHRKEYL
jgi:hypothetical protein